MKGANVNIRLSPTLKEQLERLAKKVPLSRHAILYHCVAMGMEIAERDPEGTLLAREHARLEERWREKKGEAEGDGEEGE